MKHFINWFTVKDNPFPHGYWADNVLDSRLREVNCDNTGRPYKLISHTFVQHPEFGWGLSMIFG